VWTKCRKHSARAAKISKPNDRADKSSDGLTSDFTSSVRALLPTGQDRYPYDAGETERKVLFGVIDCAWP
jgi:hypothetical protein